MELQDLYDFNGDIGGVKFTKLVHLVLNGTLVKSIEPLKNLKNLKVVDVSGSGELSNLDLLKNTHNYKKILVKYLNESTYDGEWNNYSLERTFTNKNIEYKGDFKDGVI